MRLGLYGSPWGCATSDTLKTNSRIQMHDGPYNVEEMVVPGFNYAIRRRWWSYDVEATIWGMWRRRRRRLPGKSTKPLSIVRGRLADDSTNSRSSSEGGGYLRWWWMSGRKAWWLTTDRRWLSALRTNSSQTKKIRRLRQRRVMILFHWTESPAREWQQLKNFPQSCEICTIKTRNPFFRRFYWILTVLVCWYLLRWW